MINQEISNNNQQNYKSIQNQGYRDVLQHYLQPVNIEHSSQLLSAIKKNEHFPQLCRIIGLLCAGEDTICVNLDYLAIKANEKLINNKSDYWDKLTQAVGLLQQKQFELGCLISELNNTNEWINSKTKQASDKQSITKQDCEVLDHQNCTLSHKIQQQNKQLSPHKNSDKQQLDFMLRRFRCPKFPQCKADTMKLLSDLDVLIQRLEIQKITMS